MNDETQKAVAAWLKIAESAKSNKPLGSLAGEFEALAKFIQTRSPAVAVEILGVAQQLTSGLTEAAPQITANASRPVQRVVWEIHEKDGRKVKWSCKWEGLNLRVEHARDVANKVVFVGYINNEKVTEDKLLAMAQSNVAARALERAQAKTR